MCAIIPTRPLESRLFHYSDCSFDSRTEVGSFVSSVAVSFSLSIRRPSDPKGAEFHAPTISRRVYAD